MRITAYNPLYGIQTAQGSTGGGVGSTSGLYVTTVTVNGTDFFDTGVSIGGGSDTWARTNPIYTLESGILLLTSVAVTVSFRASSYYSYSISVQNTTDLDDQPTGDSGRIAAYPDLTPPSLLVPAGNAGFIRVQSASVQLCAYTNYTQVIDPGGGIGTAVITFLAIPA